MKKHLTGLLIVIFTSIINLQAAFAISFTDIKNAIQSAEDCINISYNANNEPSGPDNNKIVEFIEEPFSEAKEYEGYEIRNCYRNIIQFKIGNQIQEHVGVYTSCLSSLQDLAASDQDIAYSCKEIQAILSTGGTNFLFGYISSIYRFAAGIVGLIAVTIIILSGIQITASGGDPEAITKAKSRIIQSIVGLAVLFLSGLILNTVNPNFFT